MTSSLRVCLQESFDSPIDRRSDYYRQRARCSDASEPPQPQDLLTIPTVLTLLRVLLVPVLVSLWFATFDAAPVLCTTVFTFASLTDCLDGYLARRVRPVPQKGKRGHLDVHV